MTPVLQAASSKHPPIVSSAQNLLPTRFKQHPERVVIKRTFVTKMKSFYSKLHGNLHSPVELL